MREDNLIIERLIRNISHEIKNPLTTIKGYSQLLGIKNGDWELVEKTRKMILANVDMIDDKINALYGIFNLTPGLPVEHDLIALIKERVEGLSDELRTRVILQSDDGKVSVPVDSEHLLSIVLLFINGFDWNNNHKTVLTIHVAHESPPQRVQVSFNFSGLDLGDQESEYFYLPFPDKKIFLKGTELYEIHTRARLNGWEFSLTENTTGSRYLLLI